VTEVAAVAVSVVLAALAVFQVALAAGAPVGRAAWGGRHRGVLPARLRIASGLVAFVVYPIIILAVLDATGFLDWDVLPGNGAPVMWTFVALFTFGALANLVSRSMLERLWAPVSLAIAVCCAFIAAGL
jgi:hypothetical protein